MDTTTTGDNAGYPPNEVRGPALARSVCVSSTKLPLLLCPILEGYLQSTSTACADQWKIHGPWVENPIPLVQDADQPAPLPPSPSPLQINNCTRSAVCDPRFTVAAGSTVAIQDAIIHPNGLFTVSRCTGTLVSSYDGQKTYVLTADHCFASKHRPSAGCIGVVCMVSCAQKVCIPRPSRRGNPS